MAECDPNPCANNTSAPSPLHFAAAGRHVDCAQLLIDAGANINAVLISAEVRLWCTNLFHCFGVVCAFLDQGPALSPLNYAEDNNELKELLVSNGALSGSEIKLAPAVSPPEKEEIKEEVEFEILEEKLDNK